MSADFFLLFFTAAGVGGFLGYVLGYRRRQSAASIYDRFDQLANSMPNIVWGTDSRGEMDYFNNRWYEMTDAARGEEREAWDRAVHPDDLVPSLKKWPECLASGEPYEAEYRLRNRKDGICFPMR
jgi:PAS domain S-box-containing protein